MKKNKCAPKAGGMIVGMITGMIAGILCLSAGGSRAAEIKNPNTGIKACADDIKKWCGDVRPGDGRLGKCLYEHLSELSGPCRKYAGHGGPGHELAALMDLDKNIASARSTDAALRETAPGWVGIEDAAALMKDPETFVLDVRTREEYSQGRIRNSALIPWDELKSRSGELPRIKDRAVLVYCRSGNRSEKASEILKSLGYRNVKNLKGGITAWEKAGREVVR